MPSFQFQPIPNSSIKIFSDAGAKDASKHKVFFENSLPESLGQQEAAYVKHHAAERDRAQSYLTTLQKSIDENNGRSEPNSLKNEILNNSSRFFNFNIQEHKTKIKHLDNMFKKRNESLVTFMNYNGYTNLPTRADISINKLWVWIIVLFLAESIINAFLFKNVVGLATALTLTTSQSFINIGSSFAVGRWGLSNAFYNKSISIKIISYIVCLAYLVFISWLNLALGLYRQLVLMNSATDADLYSPESFKFLKQAIDPFSYLTDFSVQAAVVALVGLCFAACSVFKGYFADDPRPHFGALYRGVKRDQSAVHDALKTLDTLWRETYEQARASVVLNGEAAREAAHQWSHDLNLIEKILVDWDAFIESLNEGMADRIKAYFQSYNNVSPKNYSFQAHSLFRESESAKEIVFSDAIQYHLSDDERRKMLIEKENSIIKIQSEMYENIESSAAKIKEEVKELFAVYPSTGIGLRG